MRKFRQKQKQQVEREREGQEYEVGVELGVSRMEVCLCCLCVCALCCMMQNLLQHLQLSTRQRQFGLLCCLPIWTRANNVAATIATVATATSAMEEVAYY